MSAKRRHTTRLGRVFTAVAQAAAVALLVPSLCWPFAGWRWELDLIANLNAQWLVLTAPLALLCAATRRWLAAAIAGVACVMFFIPLCLGRGALLPAPIDAQHSPASTTPELVRFFHYNASTEGGADRIEAAMNDCGADVLSVVCPPPRQHRDVISGDRLSDRFAGKLVRHWRADTDGVSTDVTGGFVVSKWPMRAADISWIGPDADHLIVGIVERPMTGSAPGTNGEFAVIAVHPRSARTAARWAHGNSVVASVTRLAVRLRAAGYPVVVLADLNATPSGSRSRALWNHSDLRRAKPLLVAAATYPLPLGAGHDTRQGLLRASFWPLSVAIDDAFVSDGIGVAGWGTLPRLDSEHLPILVDLRIPARLTPEPRGPGR